MNEEEKVNNFNETANQVKDEFKEGARDVSDTIRNVNIKEDSVATGHFIKDLIFYPLEKIKEVVNAEDGKFLKYAIIILALYCLAGLAGSLDNLFASYYTFGGKIMSIIESTISPIIYVFVPALILMLVPGDNKKSLMKVLFPLITICYVPTIVARYISLIPFIGSIKIVSVVLSAIRGVLVDFTVILEFFAIRELYTDTEGNKSFVKYATVFGIAAIVQSILFMFI